MLAMKSPLTCANLAASCWGQLLLVPAAHQCSHTGTKQQQRHGAGSQEMIP